MTISSDSVLLLAIRRMTLYRTPGVDNLRYITPAGRYKLFEKIRAFGFLNWDPFPVPRPTDLHRWIYILRFSYLKTIARKYKSFIRKIFKRFGTDRYNKATKTIEAQAKITVGSLTYVREWNLETHVELVKRNKNLRRWATLNKIFHEREAGKIGEYPVKKDRPTVTHENFVYTKTWVSLRNPTPCDTPCGICGSMNRNATY